MSTALFITHKGERCGVYQFGYRLFNDVLSRSQDQSWDYLEVAGLDELDEGIRKRQPKFILANYHPSTLGIIKRMKRSPAVPVFVILHEFDQRVADKINLPFADFVLCPDPELVSRNPAVVPVQRFIPSPPKDLPGPPAVFTVGSFGFATGEKGFDRLCALVNNQFDVARIRINIPQHDSEAMVPRDAYERVAELCRKAITRPGISLEITNHFLDDNELLRFLSENTINAFLYTSTKGRGISSAIDYALACGRPLAVSNSPMFRNVLTLNPSVCIDRRSLRDIAAAGPGVLAPLIDQYKAETSSKAWNAAILGSLEQINVSMATPDGRGFNKILDERSRSAYTKSLAELKRYAPDMLSRKIPRANIQQAFALDTAERVLVQYDKPRILAIGSYEDTAVATLRAKGWHIDEVDPVINGQDLGDFYFTRQTRLSSYDVILAVSVLEHVENDVEFVAMVADLLAPAGVAILTVDFQESYMPGMPKPRVDHRLYSHDYICRVLMPAIPDCALIDRPIWRDGVEDFEYGGCRYGFGSIVFRKLAKVGIDSGWLKDRVAGFEAPLKGLGTRHRDLLTNLDSPEALFALRMVLPLARAIRFFAVHLNVRSLLSRSKSLVRRKADSKSILVRHFKKRDA